MLPVPKAEPIDDFRPTRSLASDYARSSGLLL
jgi:hypothetical protein